MSTPAGPAVPGRVENTGVGVWGVGAWDPIAKWGQADPRRDPLAVDRYSGQAYWGRHCWGTDFWLRW
jgi:hypothetical protein